MSIYELARTNIPQSWDVLANATGANNTPIYGPALLQSKVDFVKYRLFSTVVNSTYEDTAYNPLEMHYAAKQVVLQVIPAAIDYYKNVHNSVSTSGTSEHVSYPDRIRALERLYETFTREVVDLALELPTTNVTTRKRIKLPLYNTADLVTLNPGDFPTKELTTDNFSSVEQVNE